MMSLAKSDYNIEFGHIYANQEFGEEQIKSIKILQKLLEDIKSKGQVFVTSVLVDELHAGGVNFNKDKLLKEINSYGIFPDFFGLESKLLSVSSQLIPKIPKKLLSVKYFNSKNVLLLNGVQDDIGLISNYDKGGGGIAVLCWRRLGICVA